jgi:hypothetical protein
MNETVTLQCGNCVTTDTKSRLHNVTSKAVLLCGSETSIINKRDAQKMEAEQVSC